MNVCVCVAHLLLFLQGARLTAYEFVAEGFPGKLIPDSAAAFLMAQGVFRE